MANTKQEKLFSEFPAVATAQWEEVITADLKGADYERKLVWRSGEGFSVRPYYRAEDLDGIQFLGSKAGEFPFVRGTRTHNQWNIFHSIKVTDPAQANAEALAMLNTGVNSLGFVLGAQTISAEGLDTLLGGIYIPAVEITFSGDCLSELVGLFIAKMQKDGVNKDDVKANFSIDPLVKGLSSTGTLCTECVETLKSLIEATAEYKSVRVINVTADIFSNSGSTICEELAFALAAGHDYLVSLTEAGVSVDLVASKMRFSMAVTANYFMEMAKFRAARMLWANIVKGYNPECECSAKMYTHASTSLWNQTAYDPYVNMLRGTTEAMSASIAGVDSLEVVPFNASFEEPTEFSKRIARNVELLLKHESHFDQVVDPAGGSYYVENLTQSISAEAWKLFLEVEGKDGYVAAYQAGFVVEKIGASAATKDKNIATRRQILLGANQYPNFTEVAPESLAAVAVTRPEAAANTLAPYRGAMAFEAMRLEVDRSGKEPKAFMLTCGSLAMARARSQFACNFFACAGIRTVDNTFFASVEEGVKEALAAKAEIVVICASDDDYAELAPKVQELLAGQATLVVAGAPACAAELEAKGITNFINVKSNVLETLKFYLKEMGI